MYEIRLEISTTLLERCYIYSTNSLSTVNLDSEAFIEFHDGANNDTNGFIPKLYFNRL